MVPVRVPVSFKRISEKHCSDTVCDGTITAINEKNAILETSVPIRQLENICICAQNEVFCKVLKVENQELLLRFTAGHKDFCAKVLETESV